MIGRRLRFLSISVLVTLLSIDAENYRYRVWAELEEGSQVNRWAAATAFIKLQG